MDTTDVQRGNTADAIRFDSYNYTITLQVQISRHQRAMQVILDELHIYKYAHTDMISFSGFSIYMLKLIHTVIKCEIQSFLFSRMIFCLNKNELTFL